jgi:hypothetical protein
MDETVLITCEYDPPTGVAWVILHDNLVAWLDASGASPQPVIFGSEPPAPPDTAPVISPAWAVITEADVLVPDIWRGDVQGFFALVASNNGAQRKIYANFANDLLASAWSNWARANPTLALDAPPNV